MTSFHIKPPWNSLLSTFLIVYDLLPINFFFGKLTLRWIPDISWLTGFRRFGRDRLLARNLRLLPYCSLSFYSVECIIKLNSCVVNSCYTIENFHHPVSAVTLLLLFDFHRYHSFHLDCSFTFDPCLFSSLCLFIIIDISWRCLTVFLLVDASLRSGQLWLKKKFFIILLHRIVVSFPFSWTPTLCLLYLSIDFHYRAVSVLYYPTSSFFFFLFRLFFLYRSKYYFTVKRNCWYSLLFRLFNLRTRLRLWGSLSLWDCLSLWASFFLWACILVWARWGIMEFFLFAFSCIEWILTS